MEPEEVYQAVIGQRDAGAQLHRRRRLVARGRLAFGPRLLVPLCRGGDQVRRHLHQYPRHRGLCASRRIWRPDRDVARAGSQQRQGGVLDPLPQRSRPRRRQLAGRRQGGCAPSRMHHQRARRACRQRGARGDRHGAANAQRSHAVRHRDRLDRDHPYLAPGVDHHRLHDPAQQGDRRGERVRP